MLHVALVSVAAARALDADLAPLDVALQALGAPTSIVDWDDASVDWSGFDAVVVRSPWDYTDRLDEFLRWAHYVDARTRLLNPLAVLRWNTDKHYLGELQRAGVPVVPSRFVEPGGDAAAAIDAWLADPVMTGEGEVRADFVVKPAIGAGSRDTQRHARTHREEAVMHVQRLLDQDRAVLLQPYLQRIDEHAETALMYFDGVFSHAIRKAPILRRGEDSTDALFATEHISARQASRLERDLAETALAVLPFDGALAYARVDLIQDDDGTPCLLELELTEPSLFFAHAPDAATRCAQAIVRRI